MSLLQTGSIQQGRAHFDRAIALYDPAEHRQLATRFGVDFRIPILSNRSWAQWMFGYPAMALADAECALQEAREIGQPANLIYLVHLAFPLIFCGRYTEANKLLDEIITLTNERGALYFNAHATMFQGCLFAVTSKGSNSVRLMVPAVTSLQSTGSTLWVPLYLSSLANAYREIGQFVNAERCIVEAKAIMEASGETWCKAEINRIAGEIAFLSPEQDMSNALMYFERALTVARQQDAKSWELRAAMSLARLWRDQGKLQQARELLAPVYDWFTDGFDTLDLKEAKVLLEELHA